MKYQFEPTGHKPTDNLIECFDRQIKREYRAANGDKEKCPSYWSKCFFFLAFNLTTNDWRKIRTDDYWHCCDALKGLEKTKFTVKRIQSYLNNQPQ